jgi:uncharacterized membrane protein YhaH (DUF805 family)
LDRLRALLSFQGRLDRLGFWRAYLLILAVASINLIVAYAAMIHVHPAFGVLLAPIVPLLVANLAITVRRLHDRGKSGWWLVIFFIAPGVAGGVLGEVPLNPLVTLVIALVALGLEIWGFVEIGFLRGRAAPNAFGEPIEQPSGRAALA